MSRVVDYLGLIGIAIGVIAVAILWPRKQRSNVLGKLTVEKRAIDEKARVRKLEAELGREAALQEVEDKHRETMEQLDDEQEKKARELRSNPAALSRFLVRASK